MKLTSFEELYEKAVNEIRGEKGVITINIGGIPKINSSNDIIGNCVQEWIPQWLEDNGIKLEINSHSQSFPDFSATIGGERYDMEVKCWNYNNAPAFDLANFNGFYREIYKNPSKIFAKYLIFGYTPIKHGFKIEEIFLKHLWEITSKAAKYPIGLQNKQGQPYAIRPFAFHKDNKKSFENVKELVEAIYETRKMFPLDGIIEAEQWREEVLKSVV